MNSLKPCPSSLFLLPKTIDFSVETEKDDDDLEKANDWKKKLTKKNQQGKPKNW
jgi:hypothetical protein